MILRPDLLSAESVGAALAEFGTGTTGSRIANAFGYATVGVNMRGSGCSGGVFDVFNPAQMADGYDVVDWKTGPPPREPAAVAAAAIAVRVGKNSQPTRFSASG